MCIEVGELHKILIDNNKQIKADISELIRLNGTATRAKFEARMDIVESKIDEIIDHNKKQNGMLNNHSDKIRNVVNYQENCQATRLSNFVFKKWYILIGIILVIFFIAQYFYQDNKLFDIAMQFLKLR